jgi:hypothetical protein
MAAGPLTAGVMVTGAGAASNCRALLLPSSPNAPPPSPWPSPVSHCSLGGLYTVFVLDIVFRIVALYSAVTTLAHSHLPVTVFAFITLVLAAAMSLGTCPLLP